MQGKKRVVAEASVVPRGAQYWRVLAVGLPGPFTTTLTLRPPLPAPPRPQASCGDIGSGSIGRSHPIDAVAISKKIGPAVVLLKGSTHEGELIGSGFIISSDGKIATNLHVIRDLLSGGVQLASGERFDSFSILAFDERKDIAIIKIPGFDLPFVTFGNSNAAEIGSPVLILGSPRGLQGSVTTGVISSIRDDPAGGGFKAIQTDAASSPGNSGGPLVNQ